MTFVPKMSSMMFFHAFGDHGVPMRRQPDFEKSTSRALDVEWNAVSIAASIRRQLSLDEAQKALSRDMLLSMRPDIWTGLVQFVVV